MEKDFKEIASNKTKDELVHILVHKEEYNSELVTAAEQELKLREHQNNKEPHFSESNVQLNTPVKQETPFGIYLAAILLFLIGPFWLLIGVFQAGASAISDSTDMGLLSMWNIIVSILSIVFGIGVLKGQKWGYDWGVGTALINIAWFGYLLIYSESMFFAFLSLIELIIFISLISNKKYFRLESEASSKNKHSYQHEGYVMKIDDELHMQVKTLNELIETDQGTLFGSTNRNQIRDLTAKVCKDKEKANQLLTSYNQMFRKDLVEELVGLSNNVDTIKNYCQVFIDFEIVSNDYPHERLNFEA